MMGSEEGGAVGGFIFADDDFAAEGAGDGVGESFEATGAGGRRGGIGPKHKVRAEGGEESFALEHPGVEAAGAELGKVPGGGGVGADAAAGEGALSLAGAGLAGGPAAGRVDGDGGGGEGAATDGDGGGVESSLDGYAVIGREDREVVALAGTADVDAEEGAGGHAMGIWPTEDTEDTEKRCRSGAG